MEMKLRYAPRYKRRLPVRFWEPETGAPHQAFTVDISLSGMFIATRAPLAQGARFRIELLEPEHNYFFQGEVVRSAKVAPELQRLGPSGMGVRLLAIEELVGELIPKAAGRPRAVTGPKAGSGSAPQPRAEKAGRYSMAGAAPRAPQEATDEEIETPVYLLRFASPEVFLQIFLNHREEGGFFVPTRKPAAVGEEIRVTFELLRSEVRPLELMGRVESHLRESEAGATPTGMRVTFVDPDAAMNDLRQIIRRLRGGH